MTRKNKHRTKDLGAAPHRPGWWIIGIMVLAVITITAYWMWWGNVPAGPNSSKLSGRWLRPDGGYILELSDPAPEGLLKAAYFNPRPINVSRAEWKSQEGRLGVFVELRDTNYPGSTYTLDYDPAADRLKGIYFQAALQQQFEVEFERTQ